MSARDERDGARISARDRARIGAESAESAFALLADRRIEMGEITESSLAGGSALPREWQCGVVFELDGCAESVVALLFHERHRDALIEQMMGEPAKSLGDLAAESVLTEVANIVASHVASGIADASGGRSLPSLPTLLSANAAAQLETFLRDRTAPEAARFACELSDEAGEIGALLVFVPSGDGATP